ncbi:MAG: HEAT repeat domain-containing protein, partial [archaeon]|nr:HEAT repeat domain-containing protein [archaeon]
MRKQTKKIIPKKKTKRNGLNAREIRRLAEMQAKSYTKEKALDLIYNKFHSKDPTEILYQVIGLYKYYPDMEVNRAAFAFLKIAIPVNVRISVFTNFLVSSSKFYHLEAALVLGELGNKKGLKIILSQGLNSEHELVRLDSITILGYLGDLKALPALKK